MLAVEISAVVALAASVMVLLGVFGLGGTEAPVAVAVAVVVAAGDAEVATVGVIPAVLPADVFGVAFPSTMNDLPVPREEGDAGKNRSDFWDLS